jgi:uracil-DNA glycosylase
MLDRLPDDWRAALADKLASGPLQQLQAFLAAEAAAGKRLFPAEADWFRALELTPLADVRVVILGQDPYHGEGQAHGLAFSVPSGVRPPPSLANIFKELEADLGLARPSHGLLEHWARQGVLLLNAVLTVELATAGAHQGRGWEMLTDAVIRAVDAQAAPSVFVLWGAHAQKKAALIQSARHLVLQSAHPSPLSARRGFFGSRPFSKANAFLEANGRAPVDWQLP